MIGHYVKLYTKIFTAWIKWIFLGNKTKLTQGNLNGSVSTNENKCGY